MLRHFGRVNLAEVGCVEGGEGFEYLGRLRARESGREEVDRTVQCLRCGRDVTRGNGARECGKYVAIQLVEL